MLAAEEGPPPLFPPPQFPTELPKKKLLHPYTPPLPPLLAEPALTLTPPPLSPSPIPLLPLVLRPGGGRQKPKEACWRELEEFL